MSSVQTVVECPQCKYQADADFNTRSGERWISCGRCGYHDETILHESSDDPSGFYYTSEKKFGYGSGKYQMKDGIGYCRISFYENERGDYVQWVLDNAKSLAFATMTIEQTDGSWRELMLLGEGPNDAAVDKPSMALDQGAK